MPATATPVAERPHRRDRSASGFQAHVGGTLNLLCHQHERWMPEFRRSGRERVNAFQVGERYLFKHYFEGAAVFQRLEEYYNNQQYRFEVPPAEYEEVQSFLSAHGYDLTAVEFPEEFVVVVEKYTAHPENIFKESVMQRSPDGYNCFLVTDRAAVEQAVSDGATRLTEVAVENPF